MRLTGLGNKTPNVRIGTIQRNIWASPGGLETHRSDLWIVDLSHVIRVFIGSGFYDGFNAPNPSFFATAISFPEKRVATTVIRKNSRPYNFPSWDEPLPPTTIRFRHDVGNHWPGGGYRSEIVRLLEHWRAMVRVGREGMSAEPYFTLSQRYSAGMNNQPLYASDVAIRFIKGRGPDAEPEEDLGEDRLDELNELEGGASYVLKRAWLGAYRLDDVSEQSGLSAITAVFYADDILPA